MKEDKLEGLMECVDEKYIDESSPENANKYSFSVSKPKFRIFAAAACMVLLVCVTLICVALFREKTPTHHNGGDEESLGLDSPSDYSIIYPQKLTGDSLSFVEGSRADIDHGGSGAPPAFSFSYGAIAVKAKALYVLEDTYVKLSSNMVTAPLKYKIVRFRTLEAINIDGFPKDFLYLLPERLNNGITEYDCLVIAMSTVSFGNYVMKNVDDGSVEAFTLPVFSDLNDKPQLGNMIAFTDGVFDESLWQNDSWFYGYQFGKMMLDDPKTYGDYYFVNRGSSIESCIRKIKNKSKVSTFAVPELKTEEAKAAYEYTRPFKNGIFNQRIYYGLNGYVFVFTRYINGCFAEEEIRIDTGTGEVTRIGEEYSRGEYEKAFDLTEKIRSLSEEYSVEKPLPPHITEEGKKRLSLSLFGWYPKVEGKVYGVIKTVWIYQSEETYFTQYYDDEYLLYEPDSAEWKVVERDALLDILGKEYLEWGYCGGIVYLGDYNKAFDVPM